MNAAYRRSHLAFYEKHHPRWVPLLRLYLRLKGQLPVTNGTGISKTEQRSQRSEREQISCLCRCLRDSRCTVFEIRSPRSTADRPE